MLSIVGLPLLILGLLKSRKSQGLMGPLKKMLPYFNYADTIFMSKWIFLWYSLFNYVLGGVLSARDSNERREHLVKAITLDSFFVIGDNIASGLGALVIQSLFKHRLEGVSLLQRSRFFPIAASLNTVFEQVGHKTHPAYRWARRNYWFGLL